MNQELSSSVDLLERRLALMRQLANSLEQVQTAVVRSDLGGIDGHTVRQRALCEALCQLESEALGRRPCNPITDQNRHLTAWTKLPEEAVSPQVSQRWKTLAQELTQVEAQVGQLNRVYGALLRRAQRTLQIFIRVLASSANTYAPPKCAPAIAPLALQEVSHV
jgi:flagellar biosynthesis/type III secretory pathway chaperone